HTRFSRDWSSDVCSSDLKVSASMNKIAIIIRREYLTRVRKKSFILMTILVPLLFVGVIALVAGLTMSSIKQKHVMVVDESGVFKDKLGSTEKIDYQFSTESLAAVRNKLSEESYDAVLHIPKFELNEKVRFNLYSEEQLGMESTMMIEDKLNDVVVDLRMTDAGISRD